MNWISISPNADIFIFDNNIIKITINDDIISIADSNNGDMKSLLLHLYAGNRLSSDIIKTFHEDKTQAIESLIELEILKSATEAAENNKQISIYPFMLHSHNNDKWFVRKGMKLFYFSAKNKSHAEEIVRKFTLSWLDELKEGIIQGIVDGSVKCLPALCSTLDDSYLSVIKGDEIVIFDCKNLTLVAKPACYEENGIVDFWKQLVDRAVGDVNIVPVIHELKDEKTSPFARENIVYLSSHRLHSLSDSIDNEWQVGADNNDVIARGKAIMESIERFCGRSDDFPSITIKASAEQLGDSNFIHPDKLAKYSTAQTEQGLVKHLVPFSKKIEISWVKATDYLSLEEKYVPLSFVSYSESEKLSRERLFVANSNGMAAHTNKEETIKRGVLEIIERDAIMIHWINRIAPIKIALNDEMPSSVHNIHDKISSLELSLSILRLTLDTVPVVMSAAHGYFKGIPLFICGASAAENYHMAIKKSIEELEFSLWSRLSRIEDLKKRIRSVSIYNIRSPLDHEALYMKQDMSHHLDFLTSSEVTIELHQLESECCKAQDALDRANANVYFVDMTTQEIKNLMLGIYVIRVVIPEFIPIAFGYGQEPLGMRRSYEIPRKLGLVNENADKKSDYLPHFFA